MSFVHHHQNMQCFTIAAHACRRSQSASKVCNKERDAHRVNPNGCAIKPSTGVVQPFNYRTTVKSLITQANNVQLTVP